MARTASNLIRLLSSFYAIHEATAFFAKGRGSQIAKSPLKDWFPRTKASEHTRADRSLDKFRLNLELQRTELSILLSHFNRGLILSFCGINGRQSARARAQERSCVTVKLVIEVN